MIHANAPFGKYLIIASNYMRAYLVEKDVEKEVRKKSKITVHSYPRSFFHFLSLVSRKIATKENKKTPMWREDFPFLVSHYFFVETGQRLLSYTSLCIH